MYPQDAMDGYECSLKILSPHTALLTQPCPHPSNNVTQTGIYGLPAQACNMLADHNYYPITHWLWEPVCIFFSLLFSDHSQKCKNSWCVNLTDFLHHVVTFVWHKERIFGPVLLGAHCTLEISQGITSGKMFFWRKDKGSSTSLINCNSP